MVKSNIAIANAVGLSPQSCLLRQWGPSLFRGPLLAWAMCISGVVFSQQAEAANAVDLTPPDCSWGDHFKDEERIFGKNNPEIAV